MSRLVTSSPHSQSATVTPACLRLSLIDANSTNSSSYLKPPRPLSSTTTRCSAAVTSNGRSSRSRSTSSEARLSASQSDPSLSPGSPCSPMPIAIRPLGTVKSGVLAPGSVQPLKATPSVRVCALAFRARCSTASRDNPASAAAPATL